MASPITHPSSSKEDEESEDPFAQAETQIHEALDGPIELLSGRKDKLLADINALRKDYNAKKLTCSESLQELKSSREELLNITSLMRENQAQGEMMKAIKNLEARISALEEAAPPFPEINFTCDTGELTDLIPTLGEIRLASDPEPTSHAPDQSESNIPIDKKPPKSFGVIGRKPGEIDNPNCICVDNDNDKIYITDMGKSLIHVFSIQGEYLREFAKGKMSAPHGIVSHNGFVYVTDFEVNTIFKFKHEEYEFVKKTNSRTPDERLNRPHGIAADRSELYIAEPFKHRVSVYGTDLTYKGTLLSGAIKKSFSIRVMNRHLFVLQVRTNTIKVLDLQSGDVKKSLVIDEDGIPLFNAHSFVFDSNENVYISNHGCNYLKKIPKHGGFVQMLQLGKWGVSDIRGVAVDKEDRLFVLFGKGPFSVAVL
ncbi:NHL repeat containing protein [Oopsacas minuta]|uniref:NHL repeat containing protein n=1 Tax=Oopsacas minuta TaxID=111878 RepID=A0AAV7JX38_9METZ|nr:NHL repeat containing protein [Oopsacas minuta]